MNFEIFKTNTFHGHKDGVYDISAGLSKSSFISASGDGYLVEWHSPEKGIPIAKVDHSIYAFENLNDRNLIILAENKNGVYIIDTSKKSILATLKLGNVSVFSMKTSGEKTFIGNSLGYVHVLDNTEKKFIHHIEAEGKSARAIALNPEENEFAVGYSDHKIRVYDLDNYKLKTTIVGHKNSIFTLMYHQGKLFSAGRDAHIKLWDTHTNYSLLESIPAHNYAINHIILLDGTDLMASCSMDKSIKIWDIRSIKLLKVIDKGKNASHGTSVNRLWWNKNKLRLLSGSDDRTISEWKLF